MVMELNFVSVYRVLGLSELPDANDVIIEKAKHSTAWLTADIETHVEHAERATALVHGLMAGLVGKSEAGTLEERLAVRTAVIREERRKKHPKGVYLVFKAQREIAPPAMDISRDFGTFAIAFDAIDKKAVLAEYLPALLRALTAVVVGIRENLSAGLSKVTEVTYLVDPKTGKPTYGINFSGGTATLITSGPASADNVALIQTSASALESDSKLTRVLDQLIQSLSGDFDEFRSYLSAWNALEIFISSTFKHIYADRWYSVLKKGAPESAISYFDRLREIMSDRHRLADKFIVISSLLDPNGADQDIELFKKLKSRRDEVSHGIGDQSASYPVHQTQQLLIKYLGLHLTPKKEMSP